MNVFVEEAECLIFDKIKGEITGYFGGYLNN